MYVSLCCFALLFCAIVVCFALLFVCTVVVCAVCAVVVCFALFFVCVVYLFHREVIFAAILMINNEISLFAARAREHCAPGVPLRSQCFLC